MKDLKVDLQHVKDASVALIKIDDTQRNIVLLDLAETVLSNSSKILEANREDLDRMDKQDPKYDRLLLNEQRIQAIVQDLKKISLLESPLGCTLEERILPNGLKLSKISVPIGTIGIIYEARPNVTIDVFALCFKSGNACVLKGGSDAQHSNHCLVELIHRVLKKHQVNSHCVLLLSPDREELIAMMRAHEYIDVIIPRGSQTLIDFVKEHSHIPVIETGAGIVHTFFDVSADLKKGCEIIFNAKTRRPSVCNALDTLIVHEGRLPDLPYLVHSLGEQKVEIFADELSYAALKGHYPSDLLHHAFSQHFGTEFLSLKMSIKTVSSLEKALEHIATYSSKHSEAIISNEPRNIDTFFAHVDAAVVYANTSTAFTDGAQFGMGAEIGISTQKLHARGPMSLKELTSYKWLVRGNGQVRH